MNQKQRFSSPSSPPISLPLSLPTPLPLPFPSLPSPPSPLPDWYTFTDAAILASVTPRAIAIAIDRGEIVTAQSALGNGSTTLIPGHSIREWIDDAPFRRAKQRVGRPPKKKPQSQSQPQSQP